MELIIGDVFAFFLIWLGGMACFRHTKDGDSAVPLAIVFTVLGALVYISLCLGDYNNRKNIDRLQRAEAIIEKMNKAELKLIIEDIQRQGPTPTPTPDPVKTFIQGK